MEIAVVLDNIRSTYNVGAILRSCEGFGVSSVIFSGVTPRVHDDSLLPHLREKLDKQIHKTALGAEDMLDIYASDDIFSTISKYRDEGWKIIGLENNIQDGRLFSLKDENLHDKLGDKAVLILGEEVHGIDQKLYDLIDIFVEIPMHGKKESFNVSVAAGIALYGILES
jgi:tRNA G18 (ribose-2'-O)-methylase SpoU